MHCSKRTNQRAPGMNIERRYDFVPRMHCSKRTNQRAPGMNIDMGDAKKKQHYNIHLNARPWLAHKKLNEESEYTRSGRYLSLPHFIYDILRERESIASIP